MKKIIKKAPGKKHVKRPVNTKLMIIISSVLAFLLIGGVIVDFVNRPYIMTVNGSKYDMADLGYYFYSVESKDDYYNQMLGGSYWDMDYDKAKGTTMRDAAKVEAVNTALSTEVLYREAKSKGYKLTDKELKTIDTNVSSAISSQIPKTVQDKNGFTSSYLNNVFKMQTLVSRYRQDIIDSLKIDDVKITAGVSKEDNRQYNIEYLYIPTQTTDKDGKKVDMTATEKKAAYDKINAYSEKAKTTKDWSTLIPKDEKELTYTKGNFIEKDTTNTFSENFRNTMKKMANNDVSGIYDDKTGYYVVRMLDNNSTESYDTAVKKAISDAENSGFEAYYQKLLKNYKYKINDKELEQYTMGEITLVK